MFELDQQKTPVSLLAAYDLTLWQTRISWMLQPRIPPLKSGSSDQEKETLLQVPSMSAPSHMMSAKAIWVGSFSLTIPPCLWLTLFCLGHF